MHELLPYRSGRLIVVPAVPRVEWVNCTSWEAPWHVSTAMRGGNALRFLLQLTPGALSCPAHIPNLSK